MTLVLETLTDFSLSVVLVDARLKLTKFEFWARMASLLKSIPQHKLTLVLESWVNFQPTILLKIGVGPLSSAKKTINGSFEFLDITAPLRTNGPRWIDNLSVPNLALGVGGTLKNLNWGSQPGGCYGGVSVS